MQILVAAVGFKQEMRGAAIEEAVGHEAVFRRHVAVVQDLDGADIRKDICLVPDCLGRQLKARPDDRLAGFLREVHPVRREGVGLDGSAPRFQIGQVYRLHFLRFRQVCPLTGPVRRLRPRGKIGPHSAVKQQYVVFQIFPYGPHPSTSLAMSALCFASFA